jgi:hypothetical protein
MHGWMMQVQSELKMATSGVAAEQAEARQRTQQSKAQVEGLEAQASQFQEQVDGLIQAKLLQAAQLLRTEEELKHEKQGREALKMELARAQDQLREASLNIEEERRTAQERIHHSKALATALEKQTAQFKMQVDRGPLGYPSFPAVQLECAPELAGFKPVTRSPRPAGADGDSSRIFSPDPYGHSHVSAWSRQQKAGLQVVQPPPAVEVQAYPQAAQGADASASGATVPDEEMTELLKQNLSSMAEAVEGLAQLGGGLPGDSDGCLVVGVTVTVVKPIEYEYPKSPDKNYDLRCGLQGVVTMVDEDGDVEVEWEGLCRRWLLKQDYSSIKVTTAG